MKKEFLPQELNKTAAAACVSVQYGGSSTEMHWHDCAEIIHVRRGEAQLFVADGWHSIAAGQTVFIPIGCTHCCHCDDKGACRVVIGLEERLFPAMERGTEILAPLHAEVCSDELIFDSECLRGLFERLCDFPDASVRGELERLITVQQIFCEMLRIWDENGILRDGGSSNPTAKKILEMISARFAEPLAATEVAAALNVSYSYMAGLLRQEMGTSFGELLLSERIAAAKRLLLTTDLPITDVALDAGFTDSSYFIKKFRTATGTTPHKYRVENLRRIGGR